MEVIILYLIVCYLIALPVVTWNGALELSLIYKILVWLFSPVLIPIFIGIQVAEHMEEKL